MGWSAASERPYSSRVLRLASLAILAWVGGCLMPNPAHGQGSTTGDAADTDRAPQATTSSSGTTVTTAATANAGGESSEGSTAATTSTTSGTFETSSSSGSGPLRGDSSTGVAELEPAALGQPCRDDRACAGLGIGATCCTAAECAGTCMVECRSPRACPFDDMGCEHGYCLFPCSEDVDCTPWPGATCQHGGQYCEVD